ncbi:MAG TPA: hypothetical protein VK021_06740 [Flavobacteriaceae bacterium]|nr:hypothetical protein [Flavobacteriaceae bacterium]
MWNAKTIALFLMLLFCSKAVMSNQVFGILLFGERIVLTKTYCENRKKDNPNQHNHTDQQPVTPAASCSSVVFVMLYPADQQVNVEIPQVFSKQNYFYLHKVKKSIYLELQSPPPKLV